jgi:hypothetical protein
MLEGTPIVGGIPAMLPKMQPLLVREFIAETLLGPLKTILFYIYAKYKKLLFITIIIYYNIYYNNYILFIE